MCIHSTTSLPAPCYFIYVPVLSQYRRCYTYVNIAFFSVFKAHTHKLYILRHFANIGYIYIYLIRLWYLILLFILYNNWLSFIGTMQPSELLVKQSAEKQFFLQEMITYPEYWRSPSIFSGVFWCVFFFYIMDARLVITEKKYLQYDGHSCKIIRNVRDLVRSHDIWYILLTIR